MSVPLCGLCPAFLFDPESIALHRCFGCRQPPAQMRIETTSQAAAVCRSCHNTGLNVLQEPCACSAGRKLRGLS